MGIEQFMTHEDKVESLLFLREKIAEDIVRLLSELEIDESSFSAAEYQKPELRVGAVRFTMENTLYRHCQSIGAIDNKIEEINNER
jgi:hypothetical protein